jgi:hypothetical protein
MTPLTSLISKPTCHFANKNVIRNFVCSFKTDWYGKIRVRCCGNVIYQLLRSPPAVSFLRHCAVLKYNKNVPIFSIRKRRTQTDQVWKQFCVSVDTNRFIDIVSIYYFGQHEVIVSFNAVHSMCFWTLNGERSNVQPITVLPLLRTATCFGVNTTFQNNIKIQYISIEHI